MKKIIAAFAAVLMLVPCVASAADAPKVVIGDKQVEFADVNPMIVDGRTLVPLRGVFEELGAVVEWEDETKTADINYKGNVIISLTLNSKDMKVDAEEVNVVELDVPAQIVDGRMMVPLRAVSEALECDVKWDAQTSTVNISRVKEGVIDLVKTAEVKLENGKTVYVCVQYSDFTKDAEAENQLDEAIAAYAENILETAGADVLPEDAFAAEENMLFYAEDSFYDEDGKINIVEFLTAGDPQNPKTYVSKAAICDSATGEVLETHDFLETEE